MCVCVCTCIVAYIYIHVCIYIYIYIYHIRNYADIHMSTLLTRMYIGIEYAAGVRPSKYEMCVCVHMHTCIHAYIHRHTLDNRIRSELKTMCARKEHGASRH